VFIVVLLHKHWVSHYLDVMSQSLFSLIFPWNVCVSSPLPQCFTFLSWYSHGSSYRGPNWHFFSLESLSGTSQLSEPTPSSLFQGENCSPQSKSSLLPGFANKVLLALSRIHLLTYCLGCFHVNTGHLGSCHRASVAHESHTLHYLALYRKYS
jgi:hypothetical protein